MRRIFWLALGLGAGATAAVIASRWMKEQTQKMAPANLARRAGSRAGELASELAQAAREFREGAAQKEAEVRASLED
jgi:hypothetical protein